MKLFDIEVFKNTAGSYCVVWLTSPGMVEQIYIDAKKDRRHPDYTFMEIVHNGHVTAYDTCHNQDAPDRILNHVNAIIHGQPYAMNHTVRNTRKKYGYQDFG